MGRSMDLKRKVDDQTIVDNCKISRTKISTLKASMTVFLNSWLEQVR